MQDFTYDYSNLIKQNFPFPFFVDERFNKLIKSYLFTHQFSEDVLISREDLLSIIEYFLEDGEYVFENKDKLLLILNSKNDINDVIKFLKWIFEIVSIKIVETKTIDIKNKINLIIRIENYENTFNGKRTEEYHF